MLRPKHLPVLLLVLVLLFCTAGVWAQQPTANVSDNETPQFWFVELNNPPSADGGNAAQLKKDKADFRAAAAAAKLSFVERRSFDTLWNGLSIQIAPEDVGKLSRIAGVKAIYPVVEATLEPNQPVDVPEMATAISMTAADVAQNELGLSGAGVKVGVIDTGLDYNHPDLGGCFGPGCRVVGGWDFVGDAFSNSASTPVPDDNPMDCFGHGTHVAGIIGANGDPTTGRVRGVAPGVTFYAYRVFGCSGSTSSDIMLAAMEMAWRDRVQVINMSIGADFQWPEYPTAKAGSKLVQKGIVVVASIGNSGAKGLFSAAAPGVGERVIGVASFDNTFVASSVFTISPDDTKVGYIPASGAPPAPLSGSVPLVATGTPSSTNDGCNALPAGSLAGKIALIRRGTCGFYNKAYNAQLAGAAAVVLYNSAAGALNATVAPNPAGSPPVTIPVVGITAIDGSLIYNRIVAGETTMTWTTQVMETPSATGGLVSSFSAYGLAPDFSLKPDIGAPGGNIRSTYPLALGGYTVMSGTSMASPHTAGAVALFLEGRPHVPTHFIRDYLQNNAQPQNWSGNPGLGFLDLVGRQGAGLLNIANAITATTLVTPAKLELGAGTSAITRTLTIANDGAQQVTYDLSFVTTITPWNTFNSWTTDSSVNPPQYHYRPSFTAASSSVTFSQPSVTVPVGGSATVDVTITPDSALAATAQFGGYVVFTPQGGGQTYRVPYAGFYGTSQTSAVVNPARTPTSTLTFPWLAYRTPTGYSKVTSTYSYTMAGTDIPYVLVHLDYGVPLFRIEVFEANTLKPWHYVINQAYLSRNSSAGGYYGIPFNGTTGEGGKSSFTVPNGTYFLKMSVLKPMGDRGNPADWETWTSPSFTIARP